MQVYTVTMIYLSDLQSAINIQYGCDASCEDIALALGKDSWTEGAHLIYFGPDLNCTIDLENCIITYLRDVFPNEEYIYIDFDS